jgi:hypothetical protein
MTMTLASLLRTPATMLQQQQQPKQQPQQQQGPA